MRYGNYEIKAMRGYVSVYLHGKLLFTEDTAADAIREINSMERIKVAG